MADEKQILLDLTDLDRTISRIAHEIVEKNALIEELVLVGIRTRGAFLARRIADKARPMTKAAIFVTDVDITLYRDDLNMVREKPLVKAFDVPFPINGKTVVLVDDVLFTGRTVRAAIDAVVEQGRPTSIQLAILVDRGHRELPIRADYVGKNVNTSREDIVSVLLSETDGEDGVIVLRQSHI
jgi:pyrimidine operon attenuation protein / uracil phosphoribosyltransferase